MRKKIIATGVLVLSIIGIISAFAGGSIGPLFNTARADDSPCEIGGHLTYDQAVDAYAKGELQIVRQPDLAANRISISVTNNTLCSVGISLGSYKMFGPYSLSTQSQQEFYDGTQTANISAGGSQNLAVNLPSCAAQYDIWYGDVMRTLVDNQPYGNLLGGDQVNQGNFCTHPAPVVAIVSSLTADATCVVPGTNITFISASTGTGITSNTLEKDTNADGVYGQVISYGPGGGTYAFVSAEAASYTGTYSIKQMINGIEHGRKDVTVSASCGPPPPVVVVPPPVIVVPPPVIIVPPPVITLPITAALVAFTSCAVPGTSVSFTSTVRGDGINSKTLEKDTNGDGVYGEVASFGGGPGQNTYYTNEVASYSGTYSLKLMVNGIEMSRQDVTFNDSCGPVPIPPPIVVVPPPVIVIPPPVVVIPPPIEVPPPVVVEPPVVVPPPIVISPPIVITAPIVPPVVPPTIIAVVVPPPPITVSGGGGGPAIFFTKVASPAALPGGPGLVTYTYTVKNENNYLDLIDVSVIDDKCGPLVFLSGDKNSNRKLDPYESWAYACTSRLLVTTTNTAVVIAYTDSPAHQAVTDTAIATVVVGQPVVVPSAPAPYVAPVTQIYAPDYPNAGFAPRK